MQQAKGPGEGLIDPATLAAKCDELLPLAKAGQFYGTAGGMAIGAGLIVSSVPTPTYLADQEAYATGKGPALVLTHECDIDPNNIRPFNDKALVAPLIRIEKYVQSALDEYTPQEINAFATNVASGKTTRICYLPRFGGPDGPLHFGAFIDLNFITSCGIKSLVKSPVVCSLTGYAISAIDRALQNHLFRAKADRAPLPH